MSNVSLIDGHIDEPMFTDEDKIKVLSDNLETSRKANSALMKTNDEKTERIAELTEENDRQKAEIDILIRKKETLRDEIAGLQAENEMLTEKVEALGDPIEFAQYELFELREENRELHKICNQAIKTYKETKAEAIKEFAERFEDELGEDVFNHYPFILAALDNLVKEMVGDAE